MGCVGVERVVWVQDWSLGGGPVIGLPGFDSCSSKLSTEVHTLRTPPPTHPQFVH